MTREQRSDRAAKMLADTSHAEGCSLLMDEWDQSMFTANELREMECSCDREVRAMLQFADAEAAAMRERAAKLCDERGAEEQKGFGLTRAAQNYFRARDAIRALPATGEVGRG